ncbi:MAG: 6-bladed beta-propeller [Balneolaceae bacterium]|nr:6-bladed beta-propeller [Balneolaceae bacterium]
MPRRLSLLLLLFSLALASCTGGEEPNANAPSERSVTVGDVVESHPLEDDMKILDSVAELVPLGGGRHLVQDRSPSVALFEDYRMVRTYGATGEGPCEYSGISAIDTSGDSLFVLSANQAKVVTYHLETGECLGESGNEAFARRAYLERRGDAFYTARTYYVMGAADSTQVLFRIPDGGEAEPLELNVGALDPVETPVTMVAPGLNFLRRDNSLYAYYPFTDQMIRYDMNSGALDRFPLRVDIRREEITKAGENIDEIINIIQNNYQFVQHIVGGADWIAFSVAQQNGSDENATMYVQFYEPDGSFIGEIETEERMVAVEDGRLVLLREASDATAEHTYELIYREVTVE